MLLSGVPTEGLSWGCYIGALAGEDECSQLAGREGRYPAGSVWMGRCLNGQVGWSGCHHETLLALGQNTGWNFNTRRCCPGGDLTMQILEWEPDIRSAHIRRLRRSRTRWSGGRSSQTELCHEERLWRHQDGEKGKSRCLLHNAKHTAFSGHEFKGQLHQLQPAQSHVFLLNTIFFNY